MKQKQYKTLKIITEQLPRIKTNLKAKEYKTIIHITTPNLSNLKDIQNGLTSPLA